MPFLRDFEMSGQNGTEIRRTQIGGEPFISFTDLSDFLSEVEKEDRRYEALAKTFVNKDQLNTWTARANEAAWISGELNYPEKSVLSFRDISLE